MPTSHGSRWSCNTSYYVVLSNKNTGQLIVLLQLIKDSKCDHITRGCKHFSFS